MHWTYRRVKKENSYNLNAQNGYLYLKCLKESIGDRKRYNFTGIKQRETNFEMVTIMQFNPSKNGEEAGLCLMQKDNNYILFDVKKEDNQNVLQLVINPHDKNAYIQKDWVLDNYSGYIELKVMRKQINTNITTAFNPTTFGYCLMNPPTIGYWPENTLELTLDCTPLAMVSLVKIMLLLTFLNIPIQENNP